MSLGSLNWLPSDCWHLGLFVEVAVLVDVLSREPPGHSGESESHLVTSLSHFIWLYEVLFQLPLSRPLEEHLQKRCSVP